METRGYEHLVMSSLEASLQDTEQGGMENGFGGANGVDAAQQLIQDIQLLTTG